MNCQFTRYYKEPDNKYICMSMVLFLPEKYQKLTYGKKRNVIEAKKAQFLKHIIYNTRLILSNYFPNNYYYRIYYDNSIDNDKEFSRLINVLKNNPKFQIIKYQCPGAETKGGQHIGLFGTIIRFHPLFDKESPNISAVAIMDADNIYTKKWVDNMIKFMNDDKYNLMTYQGLLESPFYKSDMKNNNKIDEELNLVFFRAGMTIAKKNNEIFRYELWEKYFNEMYNQQDFMNQVRYLDFKKYAFFPESDEQSYYSFEYGMDEIFLNFLLKKLLKNRSLNLKIQNFVNVGFEKFFYNRFYEFILYNYKHNHKLCMNFIYKLGKNENIREINLNGFKNWLYKNENLSKLLSKLNEHVLELKKLYIQTDFMQYIIKPDLLNKDLTNILPYTDYLTTLDNIEQYGYE